ncbi:hypothetical protein SFR_2038 [Streptomyces sp. FR-008]|nr:hypothetical protein SFR_2038 [Streptomyces sp. FR-008]
MGSRRNGRGGGLHRVRRGPGPAVGTSTTGPGR